MSLDLQLAIAPDGSASVQGQIRVEGDSPRVLVARAPGVEADCGCADADGYRRVGLVRMAADFLEEPSGEPVPVVLTPPRGRDFPTPGIYRDAVLRLGGEQTTLAVEVVPARGASGRRRRRSR